MHLYKNILCLFTGSIVLTMNLHAASWSRPRLQDTALYSAVEANNLASAFDALGQGANPNRQFNGTSIFIHAFEHALNRDWQGDNKVTGVDELRANVAYLLAQKGGDLRALNNYIATQYKPISFKHDTAKRMFDVFVQKLKAEAEKY